MGLAVIIVTFVLALPLYIEKKQKIVDDGLGLKPKVYTRVNLEDPRFGVSFGFVYSLANNIGNAQ